jgi:hypothetical protein
MMKSLKKDPNKLIIIVIGLISTLMIVFPVLVLKDSETSFTGLEIAFGHQFASLGSWASGEIAFNPLVLLAFVLPLIALINLLLTKNGYLLSMILFIASAILIFMIPELTTVTVTILGNVNEIEVDWTYGMGLILAGLWSIVASLLSAYRLYKQS